MSYWERYALARGVDPDDIRREAAADTEEDTEQ
jgi:capsid protein